MAACARVLALCTGATLIVLLCWLGLYDTERGRTRLDVDPSLDALLPVHGDDTRRYAAFEARFTTDDLLYVAWGGPTLFTPMGLAQLKRFTAALEDMPGVAHVESLATARHTEADGDDMAVHGFLETLPRDLAAARAVRAAALANPLYAGYLVADDGSATMVAVRLEEDLSSREQIALAARIADASRRLAGPLDEWLSGPLYVRLELSRQLLVDLYRVMPLAIGVSLLVAALTFRHLHGVLLPLLANGLALAVTMIVFVRSGHRLSYVTVLLPPTIYVCGFAYAMHLVGSFDRHIASGCHNVRAARRALAETALPTVCAALTTVIGFASLLGSDIASIRDFGAYAALGTLCAALTTLLLIPAGLALWPQPGRARGLLREDGALHVAARWAARHPRHVYAGGAMLAVIAMAGAARIEVGTDYLANFAPASVVRRHFDTLNARFAGAVAVQVVLESTELDAFKHTAALRAVAELETWLEAQPEIGGVYSLLDYLGQIERTLTPEAIDADPVPPDDIAGHLILLGAGEDIRRFADSSFRSTLLQVRARAVASAELNALTARIGARLDDLPAGLSGQVTGTSDLVAHTLDDITRGQLTSLLLSVGPIYLVLAALMRSWRIGALALIPNVLPILVFFGVLGWSGITLNLTTSLVAALVFGVAVDDTIHLLVRLRAIAARGESAAAALDATLAEVLQPVTCVTVGLGAGFLCLLGGELASQAEFGLLAAFTLAVAWLVEVCFTPALGLHILALDRARRGRCGQTG